MLPVLLVILRRRAAPAPSSLILNLDIPVTVYSAVSSAADEPDPDAAVVEVL